MMNLSVVVSTCDPRRLDDVGELLAGLANQDVEGLETIIVVDGQRELASLIKAKFPQRHFRIVDNVEDKGLAASRNAGIRVASAPIIAFVDDDAVPERGWASALLHAFEEPQVAAVAGKIDPQWQDPGPPWFPEELYWMVSCTSPITHSSADVRNGFGANMAFRRSVLDAVGMFNESLGLRPGKWVGGEDTEIFLKVRFRGLGRVVYAADAQVRHKIPPSRLRLSAIRRRAYAAGISIAATRRELRRNGTSGYMTKERGYAWDLITQHLPERAARFAIRPDRSRRKALTAVMIALAAAAVGFIVGSARGS